MARKWTVVNMLAKNSRVSNSQIEPNWVIEMIGPAEHPVLVPTVGGISTKF